MSELANDDGLRAKLGISNQKNDTVIHAWIVDTSIEYDQAIIGGFLKVSLEGLLVILRNEQHLLRNVLLQNEEINANDFFPEGFSAQRFAEIVEKGELWAVLDE